MCSLNFLLFDLELNHHITKISKSEFTVTETISEPTIFSCNDVDKTVGASKTPDMPKTIPVSNSLPIDSPFTLFNVVPMSRDRVIGVKNHISDSIVSINFFSYNAANNRMSKDAERSGATFGSPS